jgi:hypothetical protein
MMQASSSRRGRKNFPTWWRAAGEACGRKIEIWFQDEARVGQKNKKTRRWARRGTRPRVPHDQRTRSTYIFGAICPAQGKGAGLILPFCNTATMALHLQEISLAVAPGAHAVVLADQAGWHLTAKLDVPDSIAPAALTRTQSGRGRLAVHARKLAIQPGVRNP